MLKIERIKEFAVNFFTKILWRKVVLDGEPMPAGPYMYVEINRETKRGIFWLVPIAIVIRIYKFAKYWINRWLGRPNFFDRVLADSMKEAYKNGYNQHAIDSRSTERRLKIFQGKLQGKTKSGVIIN